MTTAIPHPTRSEAGDRQLLLGRRRLWAVGVALCLFLLADRMTPVVVQGFPPIVGSSPLYNLEYVL